MKSKKKFKKVVISLCIFLVVLIAFGGTGFYLAGDYIFNTLIESYVEDQMISAELLQDLKQSTAVENTQQAQPESAESSASQTQVVQEQPNQTKQVAHKMTPEEIEKKVQEITKEISKAIPIKDKINMSSLILSSLSKEEIKYLSSLLVDGISKQDLAEAKKIARSRFTQEQMKEVYAYYEKYRGVVLERQEELVR